MMNTSDCQTTPQHAYDSLVKQAHDLREGLEKTRQSLYAQRDIAQGQIEDVERRLYGLSEALEKLAGPCAPATSSLHQGGLVSGLAKTAR